MKLTIPELAVVALVGPSGSGKSSFARKHFRPTEVLSSDFCRGLVSDEENSQAATNDAFEVLYFIASKRLTTGKLVVIDATNVQVEARTLQHRVCPRRSARELSLKHTPQVSPRRFQFQKEAGNVI